MAKKRFLTIFALIAAIYFFYLAFSFINISAATYDETVHLSSGYSYLVTGRYLMNIYDHPPLAEILAAFPLKFMKLNSFTGHHFFLSLMPYHYGDLFLYHNIKDAEEILNTSRYFLLFLWGGLFILTFYICEKIFGENTGLISIILFSVNPLFISNIPLVTTDIAPTFFYFVSFLAGYIIFENKTNIKFFKQEFYLIILAAISSGLAMSSKYSMFILPPFFSTLMIFANLLSNKFKFSQLLKLISIYLIISLLVLLIVFKGNISLYSDALMETFKRLEKGRSSFIMGSYSLEGVWYYFPVAFLIKNPLFLVLSWLIGFMFVLKRCKNHIWIIFPFLIYFAASINTKVQIGVRHLLPVMPFAILMASIGIKKIVENYSLKAICPTILVFIISLFSLIKTHPFYLSYFSEIIGGAKNGYKYLTDSNIDWGQDIKTLANYLKKQGNPPIILTYFGSANPNYYGINYIPLWFITNTTFPTKNVDLCSSEKILWAVSVTNLQATYYADKSIFNWLKDKKPVYKAGYSIFVYDFSNDKEILKKIFDILKNSKYSHDILNCLEKKIKNL